MARKGAHYESALDAWLADRDAAFVRVNDIRRAALGPDADLRVHGAPGGRPGRLKTFDLVLYGRERHLLVEVKGRKLAPRKRDRPAGDPELTAPGWRADPWTTLDDIEALRTWAMLMGPPFEAVFVFLFWCAEPDTPGRAPPAAAIRPAPAHAFVHAGRRYLPRIIRVEDYAERMAARSASWRTVHLPADRFDRAARPFTADPDADLPEPRSFVPRAVPVAADAIC